MAEDYFALGNIEKSISLLNDSEKILTSIPTTYNLGEVYSLFGEIYRNQKDFKKSTENLQKAIDIHSESGASRYLGVAYLNMAKNQFDLGDLAGSKINFDKAFKIFEENKFPKEKMEALDFWISTKLISQPELYQYFDEFKNVREQYLDSEKQNAITAQEILQKTSEKEAEIAQQALKLEKETNRRNIAIGIGILLLIFSGSAFLWNHNRQRRKELQNKNELLELHQNMSKMELDLLNQRLNPHEIKNLLAGISPEIQVKAPEAYRKVLKLLNVTKAGLNQSLTEKISNQLNQVQDYISVFQTIMLEPLNCNIENKISQTDFEAPRLLLKNLVENAVKHGIRGKETGGEINITISENNSDFIMVVDDTGRGRKQNSSDEGIGLNTYQKLFETLNKKNKSQAGIELFNKEIGTQVTVYIPKNYKFDV